MKIKMNWKYAKGEFDTDTVKMLCIPARGRREFGSDEIDASLCIGSGMNLAIAEIHTGNVDSSNALCKEIVRRWNGFEEWNECKENDGNPPKNGTDCLLRVEYLDEDDGKWYTDYLTACWREKYGWSCDYLDNITENHEEYRITHWKPINKPKGVEK